MKVGLSLETLAGVPQPLEALALTMWTWAWAPTNAVQESVQLLAMASMGMRSLTTQITRGRRHAVNGGR